MSLQVLHVSSTLPSDTFPAPRRAEKNNTVNIILLTRLYYLFITFLLLKLFSSKIFNCIVFSVYQQKQNWSGMKCVFLFVFNFPSFTSFTTIHKQQVYFPRNIYDHDQNYIKGYSQKVQEYSSQDTRRISLINTHRIILNK